MIPKIQKYTRIQLWNQEMNKEALSNLAFAKQFEHILSDFVYRVKNETPYEL